MRILHISDLHIEVEPARSYPMVAESLDRIAPALRRSGADLLVVSGDLTTYGGGDLAALELAGGWVDALGLPTLVVAGNHDVGANARRGEEYPDTEPYDPAPFGQTTFGRRYGPDPVVTADLGVLRVVGVSLREGDPDRALPALRGELDASDVPVLLVGHYPLKTVRDHGMLAGFGWQQFLPGTAPELLAIIAAHPAVAAYLCGHIHVCSAVALTGSCTQISAGGLGPGTSAYRLYDVADGVLAYQTCLGAGPLSFWEREAPFTPYSVDYSLGAPDERSGTITLTPG